MNVLGELYSDGGKRYVSDIALLVLENLPQSKRDALVSEILHEEWPVVNIYGIATSPIAIDVTELNDILKYHRANIYTTLLATIDSAPEHELLGALEKLPIMYTYYSSPTSIVYRPDSIGNLDVVYLGAIMASDRYDGYLEDILPAIEYPMMHIEKYMMEQKWKILKL